MPHTYQNAVYVFSMMNTAITTNGKKLAEAIVN